MQAFKSQSIPFSLLLSHPFMWNVNTLAINIYRQKVCHSSQSIRNFETGVNRCPERHWFKWSSMDSTKSFLENPNNRFALCMTWSLYVREINSLLRPLASLKRRTLQCWLWGSYRVLQFCLKSYTQAICNRCWVQRQIDRFVASSALGVIGLHARCQPFRREVSKNCHRTRTEQLLKHGK